MLTKRIIPCLDIKGGRTVKGTNFLHLRDAGDPVELAVRYCEEGADELVFLDISATTEKRKTLVKLVNNIARHIDIPFTVGGGISRIEDVLVLLENGADKVSVNSSAVTNPGLINELANEFGTQCVVVAIDIKLIEGNWRVVTHGGSRVANRSAIDWSREAAERGAGEILLTSMENDGLKNGFATSITAAITEQVNIPVIASGGAGKMDHFSEIFQQANVDAALAASIFHYQEISIGELKQYLYKKQIPIRI